MHQMPQMSQTPQTPTSLLCLCIPAPSFPGATRHQRGATRHQRLSPAQRAGLRYQARVEVALRPQAEALGLHLHSGLWFTDPLTGLPCSPDILLESPSSCLLLIEVKLTQVDCSSQFSKYRRALGDVPCVQVCRRLTSPSSMQSLEDALHGGVLLAYL